MAKRTLLRVDPFIELSESQLIELAVNHGADPSNIIIQKTNNLAESNQTNLIAKRFSAICGGAKFYLDHLMQEVPCSLTPLRQRMLITYISQLENALNEAISSHHLHLEDRVKILREHAYLLIGAFTTSLPLLPDEVTHWLSKAEEYSLLTQPREDLITLKPLSEHKKLFYVLQVANHLPPLSNQLLDEYWGIRQNTTPSPTWYEYLRPMEKKFLATILNQANSKEELPDLFVNFSSRLRTIPGMANFRQHAISLLNADLSPLIQNRRYASSMVSSRDIQDKAIPQEVRDHYTQTNINHIVDIGLPELIDEKLSITEFSNDDTITLSFKMALQTLISPNYTSAFVSDKKIHDDKLRATEAFHYHKTKSDYLGKDKHSQEALINIHVDLDLQSTNHPLNKAKNIDYTGSTNLPCRLIAEDARAFLRNNPAHKNAKEIQTLCDEYKKLLDKDDFSQASWRDANKRELYLSSLEQLLTILQGNLSYGSCVSGKDRKAVELMHTDAMLIFRRLYGNWPSYFDADNRQRARFVNIFSNLYFSHHHHFAAELNSPGSQGIKNVEEYLPSDILDSLSALYGELCPDSESSLTADDGFASLNELRSICPHYLAFDNSNKIRAESELWFIEIQLNNQLKQEQLTQEKIAQATYINEIWGIISELTTSSTSDIRKFWDEKTNYGVNFSSFKRIFSTIENNIFSFFERDGFLDSKGKPKGVNKIGKTIKKTDGQINSTVVAQIHSILKERTLASSMARYPETDKLYTLLLHLVGRGEGPKASFETTELTSIYDGLCELYLSAKGRLPRPINEVDSDKEDTENDIEMEGSSFEL